MLVFNSDYININILIYLKFLNININISYIIYYNFIYLKIYNFVKKNIVFEYLIL